LIHCSVDKPDDFTAIRKPSCLFLGIDKPAVNAHFKDTIGTGYQLYIKLRAQLLFQLVPQTGGTGFIISLAAVFNRNFHRSPPFITLSNSIMYTTATISYHIILTMQTIA